MSFIENLLSFFLKIIGKALSLIWWLILAIILFYVLRDWWLIFVRKKYIKGIKWSIVEVKIPKEILKTPKAMEQVFSQLYSIYSYGMKFLTKYWDGEVEDWLSFEMVGRAGSIHFYIYFPSKYKNLIKSAIYSQYPDAEISEVEDYINNFPEILPNETYDLWGAEFNLAKDAPYPIKTYSYFEETLEEKRLDPLSAIMEVMSQLKSDEAILIQVLICPTGSATDDNWQKEGEKIIEKIAGVAKEKKRGMRENIQEFVKNLVVAPVEPPTWSGAKGEAEKPQKRLRPDEQETIKAIANKISKSGFRTNIRFIYVDSKTSFSPENVAGVLAAFQQFNTQNLNALKAKFKTSVSKSFLMRVFPKWRAKKIFVKKRKIYQAYRERRLIVEPSLRNYDLKIKKLALLNVEELATIYHYPITTAISEAPTIKRVTAKTGGPPPELPVE